MVSPSQKEAARSSDFDLFYESLKKTFSCKTFCKVIIFSRHFLSFRSSLLAGVFALVVGECQVTLIDSELISVAVRRADWRRA